MLLIFNTIFQIFTMYHEEIVKLTLFTNSPGEGQNLPSCRIRWSWETPQMLAAQTPTKDISGRLFTDKKVANILSMHGFNDGSTFSGPVVGNDMKVPHILRTENSYASGRGQIMLHGK